MKGKHLIRDISQRQFTIRYIIVSLLTLMPTLIDWTGVSFAVYMLFMLFGPIGLLVYEFILILGRLHDLDETVLFAGLFYFKIASIGIYLESGFSNFLIISVTLYLSLILALCIKKSPSVLHSPSQSQEDEYI